MKTRRETGRCLEIKTCGRGRFADLSKKTASYPSGSVSSSKTANCFTNNSVSTGGLSLRCCEKRQAIFSSGNINQGDQFFSANSTTFRDRLALETSRQDDVLLSIQNVLPIESCVCDKTGLNEEIQAAQPKEHTLHRLSPRIQRDSNLSRRDAKLRQNHLYQCQRHRLQAPNQ